MMTMLDTGFAGPVETGADAVGQAVALVRLPRNDILEGSSRVPRVPWVSIDHDTTVK